MSLVSIVVTANFISVMTDGRVVNNGTPLKENEKKFSMLGGGEAFVSYAGRDTQAIKARDIIIDCYNKGCTLDFIAQQIQNMMCRDMPRSKYPDVKLRMAIGCLLEGRPVAYVFSNDFDHPPVVKPIYPENEGGSFIELAGADDNSQIVFERFLMDLGVSSYGSATVEDIKQAQKQLINYVADKNDSVNKEIFHFVIEKD